jgi:hypothetical protein
MSTCFENSSSPQEISILKEALLFFHVKELRDLALTLGLSAKDNKGALVEGIIHFVATGKILPPTKIPKASCAKRGKKYFIKENALILKGAYKNDLATRTFFKNLIGPHFHFTAFGIDWINERWLAGNPPTYKEFAKMWQREHEHRSKYGSAPKQEWAYIRFTQALLAANPSASKEALLTAWEAERIQQQKVAYAILKKDLKTPLL